MLAVGESGLHARTMVKGVCCMGIAFPTLLCCKSTAHALHAAGGYCHHYAPTAY